MPLKAFNSTTWEESPTVKKCAPFIDAMTYGFLIPLPMDLEVRDGEFSWKFEVPRFIGNYPRSPISFFDSSQVIDTPFFEQDRFIIKFHNFWAIEAPPSYSLLFIHPINRADLPFTTLTGLVDCDRFRDIPVNFPARWHDLDFNGVLPKGTPIAQCVPVQREIWDASFSGMSPEGVQHNIETLDEIFRESGTYRRKFRSRKR